MSAGNDPRVEKSQVPIVITSAQDSLSTEQRGRARRYFISMMIRTACFVGAIFLPSPYRWITMSAAIVLPYIAVVIANAGRESAGEPNALIKEQRREITSN